MRLSKLYCNKPDVFEDLFFEDGLNLVLANIKDFLNKERDSHNLGKTTFAKLLDFCFLKKLNKNNIFLIEHKDVFEELIFALELKVGDGEYVTIIRGVENQSKISIKRSDTKHQYFINLEEREFDHYKISIDNAKSIIRGFLNVQSLNDFSYRKTLGYLIRLQNNFENPFKMDTNILDKEWKPHLLSLLGFNHNILLNIYDENENIENINSKIRGLKTLINEDDIDVVQGKILYLEKDISKKEEELDNLKFYNLEKEVNTDLIENIEKNILEFSRKRYVITNKIYDLKKSISSSKTKFSLKNAESLFMESGICFSSQIRKSYEELLAFNKSITMERNKQLKIELKNSEEELGVVENKLKELDDEKTRYINILNSKDIINKYKKLQGFLSDKKMELISLNELKENIIKLGILEREKDGLISVRNSLIEDIKRDTNNEEYTKIRTIFSEIVSEVLDKNAIISMKPADTGNPSFSAKFITKDGKNTSEDDGNTYGKILCIAFVLSILRHYKDYKFLHFTYLDGLFETLEPRKKEKILDLIIRYCNEYNIQIIISSISSDIPNKKLNGDEIEDLSSIFHIVKTLDESGDSGRLFNLPEW